MVDLADIEKKFYEQDMLKAIRIGNRPVIVKYLRELSEESKGSIQLPVEIVRELANYLDPGRSAINSGPKPGRSKHDDMYKSAKQWQKNLVSLFAQYCNNRGYPPWHSILAEMLNVAERPATNETVKVEKQFFDDNLFKEISSEEESYWQLIKIIDEAERPATNDPFEKQIINDYVHFCRDREYARWHIHRDKEEFQVIDEFNIYDIDLLKKSKELKFSPKWKYPDRRRKRDQTSLPRDEDIKDYLYKLYGIESRQFDKMLAGYNRKFKEIYNHYVKNGYPPDEVKQAICQWYRIEPGKLSRTLSNRK